MEVSKLQDDTWTIMPFTHAITDSNSLVINTDLVNRMVLGQEQNRNVLQSRSTAMDTPTVMVTIMTKNMTRGTIKERQSSYCILSLCKLFIYYYAAVLLLNLQ